MIVDVKVVFLRRRIERVRGLSAVGRHSLPTRIVPSFHTHMARGRTEVRGRKRICSRWSRVATGRNRSVRRVVEVISIGVRDTAQIRA